ncbi:MAG: DUF1987 domain-containing protein [Bacteroidales bacterium]|jgi:hypothetical protein|nr:DUF1987 domain-containing protein [Bacteroidales bacterium]
MQKLHIEKTRTTPEIKFSPEEKIFFIRGVSSPEDVRAMYYPVIEWTRIFVDDIVEGALKEFGKGSPVILDIDLSYFNSSSAKFLFDILTELKRLFASEVPVVVEWMYDIEDTDMKDAGADIAQLVEMEFVYIPKPKKE